MDRAPISLALGLVATLGCDAPPSKSPATEPSVAQPEPEPPAAATVIRGNPDADRSTQTGNVPSITQHEVEVGTPALEGEVIRRVVRTHIEALRACYRLGLDQDATLASRIAIEFTIGPTGAVDDAKAIAPASFPYPEVPRCIADEMRTWVFPAPRGGGRVTVSYPFNLLPD